ncbi:DUF2007 domain-containing protein [Vibrio vulnificus]|uniref:putative signal transducing protein n=1 Tax=Vibrio vulnificus TaxID=672 RepID=UPI000CD0D863|nr:DUF2007 domain-containing protein [Vibrio vulnificus]EGQ7957519.1 DUF2007 domain-containing protein [Vibrio vulnificus]EGQ7987925.1 DUF2007 domain-containing protein [Vibrio vulnificus]EGQ8174771.1 DUF2007 domain-containing protein [Vibrio vulnificus]EGQ9239761.1 DUF2007 domain-containing protein [Vibrio vulnificus]EGQ9784492.1 DUF2007 domain-containing protein [Vibrio vulnificus]
MKIFTANTPIEAHIVCQLLMNEAVQCEVRGEGLFGLRGELPATEDTNPYIWLLEPEKVDFAKAILDSYSEQQVAHQNWQCPQCGEEIEGQFGACWHCGQVLE